MTRYGWLFDSALVVAHCSPFAQPVDSAFSFRSSPPARQALLAGPRLERAIGVVYRPDTELLSHYFRAVLSDQFDAMIWFETSRAVTPLGPEHGAGRPETYPFGL